MYYKEGDMGVSMVVVYFEVPINTCLILSTIYIFIPVSGCVGRGSSALSPRGYI